MKKHSSNNWVNLINGFFVPLAQEGWAFVIIFGVVTIVLFLLSTILGLLGLALTIWCACFFRDPNRITPESDQYIISPADGVIQSIELAMPPEELELPKENMHRISIFMNVFNVHVNRIPATGVLKKAIYHPGKFLNAGVDKSSDLNERKSYSMETADGKTIVFVQIAGLIARRIVSYINEETPVQAGERFGLIRFGSRVDVYIPLDIEPMVITGQIAVGGETILADLTNTKKAIKGVVRTKTAHS